MKASLNRIPKHIGIILDGNRRFAKRLMLKPFKGHEYGYEKIRELFRWCKEYEIKEATLYTFSIENFDRPKKEFDYLMNLFEKSFKKSSKDKIIHENKIKINFVGRIEMFPEKVKKSMHELMNATKSYKDYVVNFAMAYGGRAEIIDATKKISKQIQEGKLDIENINEETFNKNMYLDSEPDLIIRTSESRLSGFLLWQGSYAEIIFLPKVLWPEFSKKHFEECLQEYSNRNRRFGK
jgi:tritrans,polycis-undecaprenyl-diphosphate synthase [geranylgeranyl-diphosphate specific]